MILNKPLFICLVSMIPLCYWMVLTKMKNKLSLNSKPCNNNSWKEPMLLKFKLKPFTIIWEMKSVDTVNLKMLPKIFSKEFIILITLLIHWPKILLKFLIYKITKILKKMKELPPLLKMLITKLLNLILKSKNN
jgi:hypothetical protein